MRTIFYALILTSNLSLTPPSFADAISAVEDPVPVVRSSEIASSRGVGRSPGDSTSTGDTTISGSASKPLTEQEAMQNQARPNSQSPQPGTAIISAKGEKLAIATGHYARARALLVAGLREFDKGLALVDPNAVVDSSVWRNSVLDRAEDLEHILDPQPRKSRGGIRFDDSTAGTGDSGALPQKN